MGTGAGATIYGSAKVVGGKVMDTTQVVVTVVAWAVGMVVFLGLVAYVALGWASKVLLVW